MDQEDQTTTPTTMVQMSDPVTALNDRDRVSLCEALDRVLNKGAVVAGEITLSVADIELVYLGLQLVVTSIARGRGPGWMNASAPREAQDALA